MKREYIDRIPKNWDSVPFKKYLELVEIQVNDSGSIINTMNLNIDLLSVLLEVDNTELEEMSVTDVLELSEYLSFFNEEPETKKTTLKIKELKDLTYDEFIRFEKMKDDYLNNIPRMLSIFSNKTPDEILSMSTPEILGGFFFAQTEHTKVFETFSSFFSSEDNQSESETSILAQELSEQTNEFQNRFGWLMIAKNVSDFTRDTFFNVLNKSVLEVLTIATLLKEQVELTQQQNNSKSHG